MNLRPIHLAGLLLVAAPFSGACGDDATTGGGGQGQGGGATGGAPLHGEGLPCDVDAILQKNCRSCHADPPKFGSPMPLVSRDDLLAKPVQDPAATVGEAILGRIDSAEAPMPPPPNLPLSDADKATLAAYVDAGMPENTSGCNEGGGGEGGAGGGYVLDCDPDVVLLPPGPFEMPADEQDLYVCFGVEAPSDIARHITAIAPMIDNETIIHHMLLLQAPEAVTTQGEPCSFVNLDWKLVYAWGPNAPPLVLPEEAGFPLGPSEPGHFVLQIHYNNVQGLVGEMDQSGIGLCTTTELRPNDADIVAFGGTSFGSIEPSQEKTSECSVDVPAQLDAAMPINIFQSWPHMHQLGRKFESHIERANGDIVSLADVPNYDFDYQLAYPATATLDVGDTVSVSCTWQNTTGQAADFGENTTDEMCFNFVAYYPRVQNALWHWLLPAYSATCTDQ